MTTRASCTCSVLCVAGEPYFDVGNVIVIDDGGGFLNVSWQRPTGEFTSVTVYQCRNPNDENDACVSHDVINVASLSVTKSDGLLLTFVVSQDRDDVIVYAFTSIPEERSSVNSKHDISVSPVCVCAVVGLGRILYTNSKIK